MILLFAASIPPLPAATLLLASFQVRSIAGAALVNSPRVHCVPLDVTSKASING